FAEEGDVPSPELLETLVHAQQASAADIVTCAFYLEEQDAPRTLNLFLGEPQGLGLISNQYGQVALVRRSALSELGFLWPIAGDPDWPLLARLSAQGASIVSVPAPLLSRRRKPGTIQQNPADALLVAQELERELPPYASSLARLAAGLATEASRAPGT